MTMENLAGSSTFNRVKTSKDEALPTDIFLQRIFYNNKNNYKTAAINDEVYSERSRQVVTFMHQMWVSQVMCDVKVVTRDGCIMTHQIVLSAHSPTLAGLFSQNFVKKIATINLPEVSRNAVAEVLNFLYTTDLRLNCRILAQVILCAKQLDLPIVLEICDDYLIQSADAENIILHFCVACNNQLRDTSNRLLTVMAQSFKDISRHPHFPLLSKERLLDIYLHEHLQAEPVDQFDALAKWTEYDRVERLPHVHKLLQNFNLEEIEPDALSQLLQQYDWITNSEDCKSIIMNVYKHHALAGMRKCKKSTLTHRSRDVQDSCLIERNFPPAEHGSQICPSPAISRSWGLQTKPFEKSLIKSDETSLNSVFLPLDEEFQLMRCKDVSDVSDVKQTKNGDSESMNKLKYFPSVSTLNSAVFSTSKFDIRNIEESNSNMIFDEAPNFYQPSNTTSETTKTPQMRTDDHIRATKSQPQFKSDFSPCENATFKHENADNLIVDQIKPLVSDVPKRKEHVCEDSRFQPYPADGVNMQQ